MLERNRWYGRGMPTAPEREQAIAGTVSMGILNTPGTTLV